MHYLTDATFHANNQRLGQGLATQLPALEAALQAQQDISFTQGNGMLLSLAFPDVRSESDTLMALLAAAQPPTLVLFADETLKAWFVLNEPCDPKRWQKLGEAIAHTLGGQLESLNVIHPLPGVMSTILYQAEKPHALGALEKAYLPRERKQPVSQDNHDTLRDAIQKADLPALVAHHYPDSNAKPGKAGVVKAIWRGDENPSFSLFQAEEGTWLYRDHGTGETGNSFGFLIDILGVSKQEAAEAIKALTFTSLNLPPMKVVPTAPKKKKQHVPSQIVKTYAYNDENYRLVYEVVRFHPKRFSQRRRDPETNKWVWGLSAGDYFIGTTGDFNKVKNGEEPVRAFPAVTPILYHLPELLASKQHNATVFVVEGEKDVETLEFQGFVSTLR